MVKGLYTAYTGMRNEARRMDVLANNLANSDTTGYKKEGATAVSFADQLAIKIKDTSYNTMPQKIGIVNLGAKIGETYTNWDQGSFEITDKPSELALAGKGFFAIAFTDKAGNTSIKYSRDGNFAVDREGYFVTVDGDHLLTQAGAEANDPNAWVRVDPVREFTVDKQHNVWQDGQIVSNVGVVDFANYDFLSKYGENMYDLVPGGQMIASEAQIEQGVLEASNVNVVDEMVQIIAISRAYEADQKMIQTEDTTIEMAVSQVGRV